METIKQVHLNRIDFVSIGGSIWHCHRKRFALAARSQRSGFKSSLCPIVIFLRFRGANSHEAIDGETREGERHKLVPPTCKFFNRDKNNFCFYMSFVFIDDFRRICHDSSGNVKHHLFNQNYPQTNQIWTFIKTLGDQFLSQRSQNIWHNFGLHCKCSVSVKTGVATFWAS